MPDQPSQLPLQGVRVLDLSAVISGPMASALLADQGADVIKIEPPAGDQSRRIGPAHGDLSAMFVTTNRGKRSVVLDLKRKDHLAVVRDLVGRADVLMENFRPGAMARLGLDAETLCAAHPRLIYASISGFGQTGPCAGARVYDAVIQAVSGISASHPNQLNGEPTLLATTVCDKLTALNAAQAISAALFARERSGRGTRLQLSMLDAALAFQWPDAMNNLTFASKPARAFPEFGVRQRAYKTRDGHVAMMTPQQSEFMALCQGLGHPELAIDPRFASGDARRHNVAELVPLLQALIAEHDTDELVDALRAAGVPIGRVNQRHEVLSDAQVLHNQALVEVDHGDAGTVRLARPAARFGIDAGVAPTPGVAPHLGQHGRVVMEELGYDAARIGSLLASASPDDGARHD